jgi:membrane-associated phospholipid phosphatase
MSPLPPIPHRFAWQVVLGVAVVTIVLGFAQGFTVSAWQLILLLPMLAAILATAAFYTRRRPNALFARTLSITAFFIAFSLVMAPLSYFVTAFNWPLIDATLTRIDQTLGFDWLALQRLTAANSWLSWAGCWIYATSGLQMLLAWVALGFAGQTARLSQSLSALAVSTAVVLLICGFVPAAGAYAFYGITDLQLGHLKGTSAGIWYLEHFYALRNATLRYIDLQKTEGVVQFPSYHTAIAVLSGWSLWRVRWLALPSAGYSAVVILTTLPIGGHYLIDLIAGAAIAAASIALAAWVERAPPLANLQIGAEAGFIWREAKQSG